MHKCYNTHFLNKSNVPFSCSLSASEPPAVITEGNGDESEQEIYSWEQQNLIQSHHSPQTLFNPNAKWRHKRTLKVYAAHVGGQLLSVMSDNSRSPEAFAANIIKDFLFFSLTESTPKKDKVPRIFGRLFLLGNRYVCHFMVYWRTPICSAQLHR